MKSIFSISVKLFLLFAQILIVVTSAKATIYYFSVSGNDSYSAAQAASQATPWKSISKLNSIFSTLLPGDQVLFKRGETFYGIINATKSGTASAPITIGAYGTGNAPVISGFVILTDWTSVGSGKYEATHASLGAKVNMVTMNGVAQELGRYPNSNAANKGYLLLESATSTSLTDNELPSSPNWTGADVVVRSSHWSLDRMKISGHSGHTLTYSSASSYTPKSGFGYFIENDVRTLDLQGEWAYNASTHKITMHFGSSTPNTFTVKASVLKNLITISSQNYITLENLSFQGANEDAILISGSTGTQVNNCDILFSGINGIEAQNANSLGIENNDIEYTNNIAVYHMSGTNATFRSNTIKNTGMFAGQGQNGANTSVGLRSNGSSSLIEYNTIENTGYCAIRFIGNYSVVKNNFLNKFTLVKDDGAGIYTGSADGTENVGRKIVGNIVLNGIGAPEGTPGGSAQAYGIYTDDNSAGIEVTGNTMANCSKAGLFIHNAYKLVVRNNNCFNNAQSQVQVVDDPKFAKITGINMKNNIFVSKTAKQAAAYYYTNLSTSDLTNFGPFDSNYYARPVDDNVVMRSVTGLYGTSQKIFSQNLADWRTMFKLEAQGKKAPKALSSTANVDDYLKLLYNDTKQSKTISLDGSYIDMRNKPYSGSITLAPYASVILQKTATGGTDVQPATNLSPTVSLSSPAADATYTAPASVRLTANASDADGSVSKIEFYRGTTLLWTQNQTPYDWTWTNVAAGTYTITAKAYDNSGNTTTSSGATITVNATTAVNQAPSVSLTSPATDATYTAPASISITANAADTDGSVSKVEFYRGTTLLSTQNQPPYDWTWTNVAAGSYTITAKAYDNKGAVTTSPAVTVTVNSAVNQPPKVSLTSPAANATYTAPASVRITGNAADADGSVSKVEFYRGTTLLSTQNQTPYDWTWTNVAAGTYTITAKAYDNKGAVTTSPAVTVTVKSAVNQLPKVSLTSPAANATYKAPASVYLTANASDADGSVSKVEFYRGSTLLHTETASPYGWTWSSVAAGTYTITAKAYDNKGAVTTSSAITITVRK